MNLLHVVGVVALTIGLAMPVHAQDTTSAYRAPLADSLRQTSGGTRTAPRPASLPVFTVQPSGSQRAYRAAAVVVADLAVSTSSEKVGVTTPLPSPTYQPYRPGQSVPEPRTTEKSCPPLGTPGAPAMCSF